MPTRQERNYKYMQKIIGNVTRKKLAELFLRQWNTHYKTAFGEWDNTIKSGQKFLVLEKLRRINSNYQQNYQHGDTSKWDCSILFDALLYSRSMGKKLNPTERTAVNELRETRNELTHLGKQMISDHHFQTMVGVVENCFKVLRFPLNEINQMKIERNCLDSFQDLPSKPTHQLVKRREIRDEILDDLEKLRRDNKDELTYFYISGNPGSGKSQLAREVCEEIFTTSDWENEITFIMTLNGKDVSSLLESYQNFCRRLSCDSCVVERISKGGDSDEEKTKKLMSILPSRLKYWERWWILVDNVVQMDKTIPFLPRIGNHDWKGGQIIVTVQNTNSVPSNDLLHKHVSISQGLKDEECDELLFTSTKTDVKDPLLHEVSKRLDRQPLTLAAAAVYVNSIREANHNFTWQQYLEKLDDGKRDIIDSKLAEINLPYSKKTMLQALSLAVENSAKHSPILKHAFNLFSMISFELLPHEIVVEYIHGCNENVDAADIYLALEDCSLFLCSENNDIRLHQVTHEAIKSFCCEDGSNIKNVDLDKQINDETEFYSHHKVYRVAVSLYYFEGRDDRIKIIPHLKEFINLLNTETMEKMVKCGQFDVEIWKYFALTLYFYGQYELSLDVMNVIRSLQFDSFPEEVKIWFWDFCGCLYRRMAVFDKAKEYLEKAFEIRKKLLDADHADVGKSYNNLGLVYDKTGDFQKAKIYYEKALEIGKKSFGAHHVNVGLNYNNLGAVYVETGDYQKAKEYLEKALEILEKFLGADYVDFGMSYNNLGVVYGETGDFQKAKEYHEKALKIRTISLGADHVDVGMSYNNLGAVYIGTGDFQKAKEYHKKALKIQKKSLGADHVDVATSYNNLGVVSFQTGDFQKAEEYHEKALEIRKKSLGADHVDVGMTCKNLGSICVETGDCQKAKEYHEKALEIRKTYLGAVHLAVSSSYEEDALKARFT